MSSSEGIFLTLLVSGILVLVASLLLIRLHWRGDIAPYGRRTRVVPVVLHPEQYTVDARLRAIRGLGFTGVLLLTGARSCWSTRSYARARADEAPIGAATRDRSDPSDGGR